MKYLVLACTLLLVGCSPQNERYFQNHPQALQAALKDCPLKKPAQVSCEQLQAIAAKTNELAYQLQANPQAFGQKILALQQSIATQQSQLQKEKNQPGLNETLNTNKELLGHYLAVVRWLESPES